MKEKQFEIREIRLMIKNTICEVKKHTINILGGKRLEIRRSGPLGWFSQLSLQLLVSTQVMVSGSWDPAPLQAPHSVQCA